MRKSRLAVFDRREVSHGRTIQHFAERIEA
jgi:hypothetical protein